MRIFNTVLAASFAGLTTQVAAQELGWDAAIEAVRQKQSEYFQYALDLGSGYPGTVLNGLGADRHRCAIAGRMLGFLEAIEEAEYLEDPPMTPDANPYLLMNHAMTLDAWVASAEYVRGLSEAGKVSLWNLECIGNFGIPASAHINSSMAPTDFIVRNDTLYVYGEIDLGFADRFEDALQGSQEITTVALGSTGGSVSDAIRSGMMIRERGLGTVLVGPCYSACPLVFAGGVTRIIWSTTTPALGFHQISKGGSAAAHDDWIYELVREYLEAMGVRPDIVIAWMLSAPPENLFRPPVDQLCTPKLATWVRYSC